MEDEWIRHIKGRETNIYPKDGQEVWVRVEGYKSGKIYEFKTVFRDDELYRSWNYKNYDIPDEDIWNLPDWWKPI